MLYTLTQEEYDALKNSAKGERQQAFKDLLQFLADNLQTTIQEGYGLSGHRGEQVIFPRHLQKVIAEAREKFVEKI